MLVDLDFMTFASLLRWKKLKGKNNLLEILTQQLKMKLNNSRVSFYLFVSYLYKINKNHALLCIQIRKLIVVLMFMDEGINHLSFRRLSSQNQIHSIKQK